MDSTKLCIMVLFSIFKISNFLFDDEISAFHRVPVHFLSNHLKDQSMDVIGKH